MEAIEDHRFGIRLAFRPLRDMTLLGPYILMLVLWSLPESAESRTTVTLLGNVSHPAMTPLSLTLTVCLFALGLAQAAVQLFVPGSEGRNRFGPDPRLTEA